MPAMAEPVPARAGPGLRTTVRAHPVAAFLVLVFSVTGLLAIPPMPDALHGSLENILGAAVPALVVTAMVGGRAGLRDLVRRALRWRVPPRWYAVSLLALPAVLLLLAPVLYGAAPLRSLAENWPLLVTSFLPTLVVMIVFDNVAEECAWTGFLFARLQASRMPARAALLASIPFCLWHFVSFVNDTGSLLRGAALTAYLLLPLVASRIVIGWLYNASGASVLIGGLFHATHNATVNPTGFAVAVLGLPQDEVLFVVGLLVMVAAVVTVLATRGRLGLPLPTGPRRDRMFAAPPASRLRGSRSRPGRRPSS
jgi:membrane protease YdiL (CAAX protease family)